MIQNQHREVNFYQSRAPSVEISKQKDKNAQNKQVLHAETTAYLSRVPLAIHHNIWYTRMSPPN